MGLQQSQGSSIVKGCNYLPNRSSRLSRIRTKTNWLTRKRERDNGIEFARQQREKVRQSGLSRSQSSLGCRLQRALARFFLSRLRLNWCYCNRVLCERLREAVGESWGFQRQPGTKVTNYFKSTSLVVAVTWSNTINFMFEDERKERKKKLKGFIRTRIKQHLLSENTAFNTWLAWLDVGCRGSICHPRRFTSSRRIVWKRFLEE